MKWVAAAALTGWAGIVWLAWHLAEARMIACKYSGGYTCELRVLTSRDNTLLWGLGIGLAALVWLVIELRREWIRKPWTWPSRCAGNIKWLTMPLRTWSGRTKALIITMLVLVTAIMFCFYGGSPKTQGPDATVDPPARKYTLTPVKGDPFAGAASTKSNIVPIGATVGEDYFTTPAPPKRKPVLTHVKGDPFAGTSQVDLPPPLAK